MKKIKIYWRRFLVWFGIMKLKPEAEIIRLLKEQTYVEEQTACDHKMLVALFPNDIWYRCTNCNQVWIVTQAMTLNANRLGELVRKLQKINKIIPKNRTTTKLKKWKKQNKKK